MEIPESGEQEVWLQSEVGREGTGVGVGSLGLILGPPGRQERGLSEVWTCSDVFQSPAPLASKLLGDRMQERGNFPIELLSLSLSLCFSFACSPASLPLCCRISQVQLADSGIFTCVAASPAGVANRNFTLQVHGTEQGQGGSGR